jgi:uncharacterized protein YbjT (DUF2867 family)
MKYVITGGAGHISKPLASALLKAGHTVTVIGRNAEHLKPLTDLGAIAATGSVEDDAFLKATFAGADAAYLMIPPKYDVTGDWKQWIGSIGKKYAAAIKDSGIKHAVLLSSIGAHLPEGCGPVSGLYFAEKELKTLTDVNLLFLRPSYFYYNLLANTSLVKQAGIIGSNFGGGDFKLVLTDTSDIADVAADALLNLSFKGHSHLYISSDVRSTDEIASVLGAAIGKPELPWITFTDEQSLGGMLQAGLPEELAKNYTEMGHALQSGVMQEDYFKSTPANGKVTLEEFANVFAAVYNQSN